MFTENFQKMPSLKQYALFCASSLGLIPEIKECHFDIPIPVNLTPDNYFLEKLNVAKNLLVEIEAWDEKTANEKALAAHHEVVAFNDQLPLIRQHLEFLIRQTEAWIPSPGFVELKLLMIGNLRKSLKHDLRKMEVSDKPLSGAAFKAKEIQKAKDEISDLADIYQAAVKQAAHRSQWLN